jgi:hypothetical protein
MPSHLAAENESRGSKAKLNRVTAEREKERERERDRTRTENQSVCVCASSFFDVCEIKLPEGEKMPTADKVARWQLQIVKQQKHCQNRFFPVVPIWAKIVGIIVRSIR